MRSIRLLVLRLAREKPTWGYRRIRVLGATAHPTAAWIARAAKNETGLDHYQFRGYQTWYRTSHCP